MGLWFRFEGLGFRVVGFRDVGLGAWVLVVRGLRYKVCGCLRVYRLV